jgi:hypothetical protein
MTGPEHYQEAEQAISAATWQRQQEYDSGADWELRRAQVHATLALAAAAADALVPSVHFQPWQQVIR